nr:reverse transcriptase domain-containing protein [Tanacetum cinerariifolium]
MSTRSSARNLFLPLNNPDLTIQKRSHTDPTLLNDSELAAEGPGDLPVPDLRTMEELCQPSLNGRGGPIAPIAIQETNFGLKNDMIQQVQNSYQFHGLPGDDANKHLDKLLHVSQSIKVNGVTDDALRLYLFPRFLTHHVIACDTINAAIGGTFMKRCPEDCYDLIENMTADHNDWDTSAQRSESSSSITSSSDTEIAALKAKMAKINKNLMRVLQVNQQVKAVSTKIETVTIRTITFKTKTRLKETIILRGTTKEGTNSSRELTRSKPTSSLPSTSLSGISLPSSSSSTQIPQPQVVTINEFTNFMKANDVILKNMQTNMTSLTNSNLELKNMFGQFMKMNTASSLGSGTLPSNTITNPKEDLKGITTRSGTAYQGPMIHTTTSSSPVVEHETEATKDTVHPANNESTEDIQPLVVQTESPILTSKPVVSPIIKPVASPVSVPRPNQRLQFLIYPNYFDADPRVPLILRRSFLKIKKALIDVFEDELTLRVGKEAITFNLDQTSRYSTNYNDMTANRIDVIDMACEEYTQEVLSFFDVIPSGNPTPYYDPIVSTTSLTLSPFENSDFFLEEVDAFLALEDDPTSPEVDQSYELKICEAKTDKSSMDEPPEVELKDLPPHLKYAFLEGDDKLPVIIAKDLSVEEKTALITFLKSHKRAVAWKLSDRKGIDPEFCTHKILIEEDFEPVVQHQRRVNPKIYDVIKQEVLLLQEFTFKVIDTKGVKNLAADHLSRLENPHQNVLDYKEINESFPLETLNLFSTRAVDYLSKCVEAKALPTNDARVIYKFLKNLFAKFGTPRAIISDRGTYFCNDQFAKVMLKFGVTHHLATPYHPQTSG